METINTIYDQIPEKVKEKLPSKEAINNFVDENNQILTVAGGAFLAVLGLRFFSKTAGFLAFATGAALLYRTAASNPNVKDVLDKIATPAKTV